MHYFSFHDNALHAEQVSLVEIAEQQGTPTFVYSASTIRDHYQRLDEALAPIDHEVAYAVKANSNVAVLALLAKIGASFDIVSGGELYRVSLKLVATQPSAPSLGWERLAKRSNTRSNSAFTPSTSSPKPSSSSSTRSQEKPAKRPLFPFGSIPTLMPKPTNIFPPASPRTSSASTLMSSRTSSSAPPRWRTSYPQGPANAHRIPAHHSAALPRCGHQSGSPRRRPQSEIRHRVLLDRRRHWNHLRPSARVWQPRVVGVSPLLPTSLSPLPNTQPN